MGKIVVLMGKSASGKDAVYKRIMSENRFGLKRVVPYTTRPIRVNEQEGREYHFVTQEEAQRCFEEGRIIEQRTYETVSGLWTYFTADDGQIDLQQDNYLIIGTPEAYIGFRKYFGTDALLPVYLYSDDDERLLRAVRREKKQERPNYAEVCRRFLADETDFSEGKLEEAGIGVRFYNQDLTEVSEKIEDYLAGELT